MAKPTPFVLSAALAVVVVFVVHFLDFPGSVPRFEQVSGGGILFDASPAFTVDATYERLADYGESGRRSYAFRNVTVDLLLPLSLLPFLLLLILKAIAPLKINRIARLLLLSVPFAYVLFDLAENALVLSLIENYPERVQVVATILPYVTVVKRAASLLAIFLPLAIFGFRFLQRRFGPPLATTLP